MTIIIVAIVVIIMAVTTHATLVTTSPIVVTATTATSAEGQEAIKGRQCTDILIACRRSSRSRHCVVVL